MAVEELKVGDRFRYEDGYLDGTIYEVLDVERPLGGLQNVYQTCTDWRDPVWYTEALARVELVLPEEPKATQVDSTDGVYNDFIARARERYEAGKQTYGTRSFESSIPSSIEDMKQETLDICNYAAMLYHKLSTLETRLREIRDKMEEVK